MEVITDKDIFLKVKNHLLTQNQKSVNSFDNGCVYRSDLSSDGKSGPILMCAVGYLISDEWYKEDLETCSVYEKNVSAAVINSNPNWKTTDKSFHMLERLQEIHDGVLVKNWNLALDDKNWVFDQHGSFCKFQDSAFAQG